MKAITAKDFYTQKLKEKIENPEILLLTERNQDIINLLEEFASLHVSRALQKAAKEARIEDTDGKLLIAYGSTKPRLHFSINKHSITNAYPPNFIK